MSNQWGRGTNGAATRGGSGAGGILFASILCLALGGAAGYGASRLTGGGAGAEEIAAREGRIAELAREIEARDRQAGESERAAAELRRENEALARRLETRDGASAADDQLAREITASLEQDLQRAAARADEAEQTAAAQAERIAALESSLEKASAERALANDLATAELEESAANLRRDLDAARAELARKDAEIAALGEAGKTTAAEQALANELVTAELEKTAAELRRDLDAARAELARKDAEIAALDAAVRAGGEKNAGESAPVRENDKPAASGNPRNAALVALALEASPGIERLSREERGLLERALVSGECVTNALGVVFPRVPVLTLRNLMRDLESDC